MNLKLLPHVSLQGVQPELVFAFVVVAHIFEREKLKDVVITSVRNGQHMPGSRHYLGLAFDIDPIGLDAKEIKALAEKVRAALSVEFDVIAHAGHIHIEFDPKVNTNV